MKLYSLASSSSGNCYLYIFNETKILIDLGMSNKKIIDSLKKLNYSIDDIDQVLITHEHIDHIKGLEVFQKKYQGNICLTKGTKDFLKYNLINSIIIEENKIYEYKNIKIEPVKISHDANEPLGFIFEYDNKKYAHILDTGYIPVNLQKKLKNLYFYLIESNYEEQTLISNSKYPHSVKQRINSDIGHLSNKQCNEYLKTFIGDKTKIICFGHLSENNNDQELVDIINHDINCKKYILKKEEIVEVICK